VAVRRERDPALAAFAFAAAAVALLVVVSRWPRRVAVPLVLLAVLHLADLEAFARRFLTTRPAHELSWPEGLAATLLDAGGPGVRVIPPPEMGWPDHGAAHGIGNPGGYDIFLDGRYVRYMNRAQGRPLDTLVAVERTPRGSRLLDHLGAAFLLTREPLVNGRTRSMSGFERFAPHRRVGSVLVYRDLAPAPRAALAHAVEVVANEEAAYLRLESPGFSIAEVVLVEATLPPGFAAPEPAVAGEVERARIVILEANRVVVEVEAASRAVLVLSDTLQPGWSAAVDGAPVPVVHANRVMRAVPVPAGRHDVVMTYLPTAFVAGGLLSVLSVTVLAGAAWRWRRGPRDADGAKDRRH
jgi:hypothetical protein